jgi:hypothetical protein
MEITKQLEELSHEELNEINAGGFFYDLAASMHRTWCKVKYEINNGNANQVYQRW